MGDETFDQFRGTADVDIASDELKHAGQRRGRFSSAARCSSAARARHRQDAARRGNLAQARLRCRSPCAGTSKSTTKAKDGLYVYDIRAAPPRLAVFGGDVKDIAKYIKLGPLGEALSHRRPRSCCSSTRSTKCRYRVSGTTPHCSSSTRCGSASTRTWPRDRRGGATRRDHHLEQREGAAGRVPAPLRVPLHPVPRSRADGADRPRPSPSMSPTRVLDNALEVFFGLRATPKLAQGSRRRPSSWTGSSRSRSPASTSRRSGTASRSSARCSSTEADVGELLGKRAKA